MNIPIIYSKPRSFLKWKSTIFHVLHVVSTYILWSYIATVGTGQHFVHQQVISIGLKLPWFQASNRKVQMWKRHWREKCLEVAQIMDDFINAHDMFSFQSFSSPSWHQRMARTTENSWKSICPRASRPDIFETPILLCILTYLDHCETFSKKYSKPKSEARKKKDGNRLLEDYQEQDTQKLKCHRRTWMFGSVNGSSPPQPFTCRYHSEKTVHFQLSA